MPKTVIRIDISRRQVGIILLLICLVPLSMAVYSAFADPYNYTFPARVIPYQGRLDLDGAPTNGTVDLEFSLFSCLDADACLPTECACHLWTEEQSVAINSGRFSVGLGETTPLPNEVFETETLYLGIRLRDSTMTEYVQLSDRQQIHPTPYSVSAFQSLDATPIGTILAWHGDYANTPPLPSNWVECNGQVLDDPLSPYDGQTIPDLNGEARFIRGGATSGTAQDDSTSLPTSAFVVSDYTHYHLLFTAIRNGTGTLNTTTRPFISYHKNNGSDGNYNIPSVGRSEEADIGRSNRDTHNHTLSGGDSETRPVNMSMNWIMRVR